MNLHWDVGFVVWGAGALGHSASLPQGLAQGREEGKLTGKIQMFQELLGEPVSTDDELLSRDPESLMDELAGLQARLRRRDT